MATNALALRDQQQILSPQHAEMLPAMTIQAVIERRNLMVEFVKKAMVEGVDYGKIPGTDKPTLLKPGAEKLSTLFRLSLRPTIVEKVEDWNGKDHNGEPFFYYLYRYSLYSGDLLIAEADGSCNSFEKKYRWRKSERVCPQCGVPSVFKSKDGTGFYCWQKKDGCGAKFRPNDPEIINQETGRVPNPDIADQVNTIQKMAQKRALIAATLLAVNASEFFTQDMDDLLIEGNVVADQPPTAQSRLANDPQAPLPSQQRGKTVSKQELIEKISNMWADEYDEFGDVQKSDAETINLEKYTAQELLELGKAEHRRIEARREKTSQQ